jgi:CheY-like chemotaxis protein
VGLYILLVEDHQDTADTTATLLRLFGHQVDIASDGPRALALAQVKQPDVVLLDIGLPGMSGYEVAKKLRSEQKSRMLLIATTGYGHDADERLRSYEAGIDLHLTKPVGASELECFLQRFQEVARWRRA